MIFGSLKKLAAILTLRHKILLVWFLVLGLIGATAELFGFGMILLFIKSLGSPESLPYRAVVERLTLEIGPPQFQLQLSLGLILIVVILIRMVFGIFQSSERLKIIWRIQNALVDRYFRRILMAPVDLMATRNSADLLSRLTLDCTRITRGLINGLMVVTYEGILALAMIGFLLSQQFAATIFVFGTFLSLYAGMHLFVRQTVALQGRRELIVYAAYNRTVLQALRGFMEVKLYAQERALTREHDKHLREKADIQRTNRMLADSPRHVLEAAIIIIGLSLSIWFMLREYPLAAFSDAMVTIGVVVLRLFPAANRISQALSNVMNSLPALDGLYKELLPLPGEPDPQIPLRDIEFNDRIQLEAVSFTYLGSAVAAVSNVSLTIRRNTTIGFVGGSGSGKSTIVKLVAALLSPDQGAILVDGRALSPETIRVWQQHIGYVPQDIFLLDASIRDNIAFGRDNPEGIAPIVAAAQIAQIHDFIEKELPVGYDSMVGENGVRLSGGQRQRIGIARALFSNPDVLILDEATSALDAETEDIIKDQLRRQRHQRTMLIVAHRPSTLELCDQIVRIENGRIVAGDGQASVSDPRQVGAVTV